VKNVDGARIKALREQHNWSQQELAEYAGVSLHTVFRSEKGTNIQSKNLEAIAVALNTSVAYLMGETDDPKPRTLMETLLGAAAQSELEKANEEIISNVSRLYGEMISVPLLSQYDSVCCGGGFSYEDIQHDIEGMIYIPEEDLRGYPVGPSPIYAVYAEGDSMEPNIKDGERYVINPNADIREGEIAFLRWKGRDLMRAIFYEDRRIKILRSAKPERYKDIIVTGEDIELEYLQVMGKVMFKVPRAEKVRGLI
jgi:phage repressor protein C with HTH and peptisase S24 domain